MSDKLTIKKGETVESFFQSVATLMVKEGIPQVNVSITTNGGTVLPFYIGLHTGDIEDE